MDHKITSTELAKSLSDILNRIRYRGERFVIERNGEPIATFGPTGAHSSITLQELAERMGSLSLPGEGFAEDLEAIQAAQPSADFISWDS